MGKCSKCGSGGFLLKTDKCLVCGSEVCEKCMQPLLRISEKDAPSGNPRILPVCSAECHEKFKERLLALGRSNLSLWWEDAVSYIAQEINADVYEKKVWGLTKPVILSDPSVEALLLEFKNVQDEQRRQVQMQRAKNLERSGLFEEAAEIYQRFGMYDEAGRARRKDKMVMVKQTDVSVDLNALLQQIKNGGMTVVFSCPNCGGKLKIGKDTSTSSLRICEHCGKEIQAIDVADFLKTALS